MPHLILEAEPRITKPSEKRKKKKKKKKGTSLRLAIRVRGVKTQLKCDTLSKTRAERDKQTSVKAQRNDG